MQTIDETTQTRTWHKVAQGIAWFLLILQGLPMSGQIRAATALGAGQLSRAEAKPDISTAFGVLLGANLALIVGGILWWRTKGQRGKLICAMALILMVISFVLR